MENREYIENINENLTFVEKDYKHAYASFGLRALAFIIDMLIAGAINNIIMGFGLVSQEQMFYNISVANIQASLVTLAYFTIASLITNGQSLGKMITGLRVVSLFILYILPIFTPKNQGLIDFFVDTAVVKEEAVRDLYGKEF